MPEETTKNPNLISVESPKTARSIEFEKDLGANLQDAVAKYTEEVVFSIFHANAVIKTQSSARRILDDPAKTEADAIAAGQAYVPGVVVRKGGGKKKDPVTSLAEQVKSGKLSKKELLDMINKALAE